MAAPSFVDMATSHADRTAERLAAVAGIRRAPTPKLVQFMLPHFLDAETCTALIERIDRDARPSTIADPNGDEAVRTSTTCDLDHRDPFVHAVNDLLHAQIGRAEEHTSELQSLMRISYAVFCLKKKK